MIPRLKSEGYSRDGIRLYPMDGGGGGSTGSQTQVAELPEWAKPYAKSTLEKGAALSETPYQAYNQPRIAGFSPMQQQAQEGAANMQTNQGTGMGMGIAGAAALGGLNQDYQGGQFQGGRFGNRQAAQYMSPFIEQAMQPQLREAQRSSDIMGQQNAAKAVGQGAFGGSRSGLVEAERQRNLGMQQGDIRAKGYQTAYEQAANQFNQDASRGLTAQQLGEQSRQFGANLGLQGLNTALQGANTLGQLGGQQFQQGMDINKLQSAYGGQQQALRQQGLSQAYQDFQDEKNYPYKQLGFMSDMVRGLPLGQQSTRTMYEPGPNLAQNIGALGMGAYGLSKFMADGGLTSYADGGSVDSADNVSRIVSKLSDQQLQQAMQAAQARGDQDQLEAIQSEMAMRASERNGLASAVTPDMANQMAAANGGLMDSYAGGGILAFQSRGVVDSDADSTEREQDYFPGNKKGYDLATQRYLESDAALAKFKPTPAMTKEDRAILEQEEFERRQKFAGEDPYASMAEKFKTFEVDRAKNLEEGKGLAALQAIPAILQGRGIRGIGAGIGALGGNLAGVAKADAAEKRALASMDFNLKDAQRKERMGLTKDAMASVTDAQKDRIAADKAQLEALKARNTGAANAARAFRPTGSSGAGSKERDQAQAIRLFSADIKRQFPDMPQEQVDAQALQKFLEQKSPGLPGVETRTDAATQKDARTAFSNRTMFGGDSLAKEYRAADKAGDVARAAELKARIATEEGYTLPGGDNKAKPVSTNPAGKPPDISMIQGAPKGSKIGEYVQGKGYEIKDSKGKLLGYAQGQ